MNLTIIDDILHLLSDLDYNTACFLCLCSGLFLFFFRLSTILYTYNLPETTKVSDPYDKPIFG